MSALELNAEIYRNLSIIANSEKYLREAVEALQKIAFSKKASEAKPTTKIHLHSTVLPMDEFVGCIPSDRSADDAAREEYARTKYGIQA